MMASNNTNTNTNPPVIVHINNCNNIIVGNISGSVNLTANNSPAQPPTGVNDEDENGTGEKEIAGAPQVHPIENGRGR